MQPFEYSDGCNRKALPVSEIRIRGQATYLLRQVLDVGRWKYGRLGQLYAPIPSHSLTCLVQGFPLEETLLAVGAC